MDAQDVARAGAVLGGGDAALPTHDGEPVFAEPWEGRVFALAVDVVERAGLSWDEFRARLMAAIATDPGRPYYESWVVALEQLALDTGAVGETDLAHERDAAASYRYHEDGLGDVEVFPLRLPDDLAAALATLDLAAPFDVTACRHAEHYRQVPDGGWRFRAFDADDALIVDVPAPAGRQRRTPTM